VSEKVESIFPTIVKSLVIVLPASLLPDRFPLHPNWAFGAGLVGGYVIQHFIPPRGRYFWPLLGFVAAVVAIYAYLK